LFCFVFFLRGCWAISKKDPAQQKWLKKNCARGSTGVKENQASAFYYPGPIFDVKKNSCASWCPPKENYIQPKSEKKIHAPQNCPTPPPPPTPCYQINNGLSLR